MRGLRSLWASAFLFPASVGENVKTYVAMYRCADGRRAAERISDTSLQAALGRARWRAMAVAIAHGVAWTEVELVGIEELQEDAPVSGLARAAVLAARLAEGRQEAHRLVDAALMLVERRAERELRRACRQAS